MEKMYQQYKDVAEFRMIYIKEAHAADSERSVKYAKEKGINNHKNMGERCTTAKRLIEDKSLTIPTLVDDMEDSVNVAYSAHPDRVFVVRTDGRLAVAAARGPWGFPKGVKNVESWLAEFEESGVEPDLPEKELTAAKSLEAKKEAPKKDDQ